MCNVRLQPQPVGYLQMTVFLLTYDLRKKATPTQYQRLWDELKRLGAHRILESAWLINLSDSGNAVVRHFRTFIDQNDGIFITIIRKNEHWYIGENTGTNDWLAKNPPS
jgi:hypothetical protein